MPDDQPVQGQPATPSASPSSDSVQVPEFSQIQGPAISQTPAGEDVPIEPDSTISAQSQEPGSLIPESTNPVQSDSQPVEPSSMNSAQSDTPSPSEAAGQPSNPIEPNSVQLDTSSPPESAAQPPAAIEPSSMNSTQSDSRTIEPDAVTAFDTDNQHPSFSFGDLLKKIKPEDTPHPAVEIPPISQPSPQPVTVNQAEIQKQTDEKLKTEFAESRRKGTQTRMAKRQKMLDKLMEEVRSKGKLTSREAQEKFNLPQSTLGDYFQDLVSQNIIKKFGRGRGMYYTF
jgi:hypothetical protein